MKNKLFIISLLLTCIGSGYAQRIFCDSASSPTITSTAVAMTIATSAKASTPS